jgi:hypothetical protein
MGELMSKFIHFEKIPEGYEIIAYKNNATLGYIIFYQPWKKWTFYAASDEYVFDSKCLQDIIDFLETLE